MIYKTRTWRITKPDESYLNKHSLRVPCRAADEVSMWWM